MYPQRSNPQKINHSPINFSPTLLDPEKKKIFPCLFQQKNFFPPRPGFELTLLFSSQHAKSALNIPARPGPAPPIPRPPPPPPLPCDHVIVTLVSDGLVSKLEGWVFFSLPNAYIKLEGWVFFPYQMPRSNTTPQVHLTYHVEPAILFPYGSAVSHPKSHDLRLSSHFRFIMTSLPVLRPQGPLDLRFSTPFWRRNNSAHYI